MTGDGLRIRRRPYVNVPAATVNDSRLSFKALGLLVWALNKPPGWKMRSESIAAERGPDGKAAIQSALRELALTGYYRIERRRLRNGQVRTGTAISEEPVPEWAEQYAESGGPVTVIQQPDGSFLVRRKNGTLEPDGFEDTVPPETPPGPPEPPGEPGPDDTGGGPSPGGTGPGAPDEPESVPAGQTGNRFSAAGQAGAGSAGPGKPCAIVITENSLPTQGGEPPVGPPGPEREPSLPADAPAASGGCPPDMPASKRKKNPGRSGQDGPEPAVPGMLAADPEIAALAAEVLAIRPGWTETAVTVAIANARKGPDSWETIREVMLDVARDRQSCYPARLMPQLLLRRNGPRSPKPGRQASTRPQRIPLPDGWQPTEAMLRVASRRFPSLDLHAETALFIRHYRGEETRAANWAGKWEEWLQRQEKWAAERERRQAAAAPRTATSDQRVAQVDAVMARRRAARNSAGQESPESGYGVPPGAPVITAKPEWLDDVISTVSEM